MRRITQITFNILKSFQRAISPQWFYIHSFYYIAYPASRSKQSDITVHTHLPSSFVLPIHVPIRMESCSDDSLLQKCSTSNKRANRFQFYITLELYGIGIRDSVDAFCLEPHLSRTGGRSYVGDIHHLRSNLRIEAIPRTSKNSLSEGKLEPKPLFMIAITHAKPGRRKQVS
jgi:hypothetical protein